jgi:Tfp pilus assembly protein PilO
MITRYIVPVVLVLIASFLIVYTLDNEYARAKVLIVEEEKLDTDIADADTVEAKRAVLIEEYAKFPQNADAKLHVLLPDDIHPARIVMDVSKIAERNGIELTDPAVQKEHDDGTVNGGLTRTVVSFSVTATYDQFRKFVSEIEQGLQLREPRDISFTAILKDNQRLIGQPIYDFKVTLSSYSLETKN